MASDGEAGGLSPTRPPPREGTGAGDRAAQSIGQGELAGGDRRGGGGGRDCRGCTACRRCRHGDGERDGRAVAPAHGPAALWAGADSSRRRAGPAWSCRSARAPGSCAAVATGGGSGPPVVAGEGGIRPDLRWSVRRVGPGGGRAPWCWACGCDRSPAGRCPGAPGLAGGAHLGSRRRARPWLVPGAWPGTRSRTRRRQRSRRGMGCGRPPRPARPPPRPSRRPSAGGARGGGPRGLRRAGGGAVRDLPRRGRSGSPGSICRVLAVTGSDPLRLRRHSRTTSVQPVDSGMHAWMEDSMVKRMQT